MAVRLTDEELNKIKDKALKEGLSLSDYIRMIIRNTPLNRRELTDYAHSIVYEIHKIGANVNQLAKNANINSFLTVTDKERLFEMMKRLRDLSEDAVRAAAGKEVKDGNQ